MCYDVYGFKNFSEYCSAVQLTHSQNSISVVQMILELSIFILKAHALTYKSWAKHSWAKHIHFRTMFIPLSTLISTHSQHWNSPTKYVYRVTRHPLHKRK